MEDVEGFGSESSGWIREDAEESLALLDGFGLTLEILERRGQKGSFP